MTFLASVTVKLVRMTTSVCSRSQRTKWKVVILLVLSLTIFVYRGLAGPRGLSLLLLRDSYSTSLYDDVNAECLQKVNLDYWQIQDKYKKDEEDVDISEWDADRICKLTEKESEYERTVFDNIFHSEQASNEVPHITYVTHFSYDRLDKFVRGAGHWPGTISAAVQIPADQVREFVNQYCRQESLYTRNNIQLHLVIQKGIFYPYNHFRNVALERALTTHVFVSDIDLVPSQGLEQRALKHFEEGDVDGKKVLVVPSFEITQDEGYTVPEDKAQLLQLWDSQQLREFYVTRYAPAYLPLNYTIWRNAENTYEVEYWDQFEPYIIAEKSKLQPYTNRFVGRFYNKATHIAELFCMGYKFVVAPDIFNVHLPHESIHEKAFDAYFRCIYSLYNAYKSHLENKYGVKMPPKAPLKPDGT